MLAPWAGGASAAAAVTQGGCVSMVAFWMGGACSAAVPLPPGDGIILGSIGAGAPGRTPEDDDFPELLTLASVALWHLS